MVNIIVCVNEDLFYGFMRGIDRCFLLLVGRSLWYVFFFVFKRLVSKKVDDVGIGDFIVFGKKVECL